MRCARRSPPERSNASLRTSRIDAGAAWIDAPRLRLFDLGGIAFAKYFADSAGHYARPDVFSFGIDRAAREPSSGQRVAPVASIFTAAEADDAGGDASVRHEGTILAASGLR